MAKEQNISLNPSKISGNCGRLMCCLKYEQEAYEEKLKKLPNIGAIVKTPEGQGEVEGVETLKEIVKVKIKDGEIYKFKRFETKVKDHGIFCIIRTISERNILCKHLKIAVVVKLTIRFCRKRVRCKKTITPIVVSLSIQFEDIFGYIRYISVRSVIV